MKTSYHRPSRVIVNLAHIRHNILTVASRLRPEQKKYAVVKANAYGHGAVAVAQAIQDVVDGYCVSNIDEGLELREAGLTLPILILGVIPVDFVTLAIKEKLTVTVASLAWLEALLMQLPDLIGLKVHLKVDSGMGRIGVRTPEETNRLFLRLQKAGAQLEGIFTHFATADEVDETQFNVQVSRFQEIIEQLPERPDLVHLSNSAASVWHPDLMTDLVRLGDVIYGLNPSGRVLELPYEIKPALSLVSELIHVKQLPAGATVGYGATYKTDETSYIGTIPLGYADGVIRKMQDMDVLVDGVRCQIVGRVSMDQITVLLPKLYPLGTPVTLIGQDGCENITADDWADKQKTINYEVVCLLSDRLPRIYLP